MQREDRLDHQELLSSFPSNLFPTLWETQIEALEHIARLDGNVTLEAPTGTGKTLVGVTFLEALKKRGIGPLFYTTINKTLVEQVKAQHPDVAIAEGRNAHPCLYYNSEVSADDVPCSILKDCWHRVDQESGQTFEKGAEPCPYLLQKFQAKQSPIVVSTLHFYLFLY